MSLLIPVINNKQKKRRVINKYLNKGSVLIVGLTLGPCKEAYIIAMSRTLVIEIILLCTNNFRETGTALKNKSIFGRHRIGTPENINH